MPINADQCLYPDENIQSAACEMEGVISPLVGPPASMIGAMQAMEAANILPGQGTQSRER